MTATNWAGPSLALAPGPVGNIVPATSDVILLDADGEQGHHVGHMYWQDRGSHTVSSAGGKIHWLPGASISFVAVSTLQIGIQDADTANGPAPRGDATFDVSATLVAGVDTISTTTYLATSMGSGSKTIAHGAQIAVVFKLAVTSGSQSIKVRGSNVYTVSGIVPTATLEAPAATFTAQAHCPNLIIEADDGTFGTLYGTMPFSVAPTVQTYKNNDATKEYGNILQFATPVQIDGFWVMGASSTNAANFTIVLYSDPLHAAAGPTIVESVAVDANTMGVAGGSGRFIYLPLDTIVTLSANTNYVVSMRPDVATNISLLYMDEATNAKMAVLPLGVNCYGVSRNTIDEGTTAFSSISSGTRRFFIGVSVCGADDGAGSAGGMVRHPGMGGGIVG